MRWRVVIAGCPRGHVRLAEEGRVHALTAVGAVGLDAAGKTTILYKLKLGEVVTTIPTIGGLTVRQSLENHRCAHDGPILTCGRLQC
jgi:hypothetical protein